MKLHPLPLGAVIIAAVAALGITFAPPAPVPRYTQVTPPQDLLLACQPVVPGTLYADGSGDLTVDGGETREAPFTQAAKDEEITLRGVAPSGGILGENNTWAPCQRPATSGFVVLPAAERAELRLTNADTTDASVDLTLLGPDGEVVGLGARGIVLSPGESRPVALSVLAKGVDGPLGVAWQTTRGRVVAAGVTTGEVLHVGASTQAETQHLLPGLAAGSAPTIVLVNPGVDRATVSVKFHSQTNTLVPEGGQDISVPARSSVAVALEGGTAGELGAFTVASDQPVAAALYTGTAERRATSVNTVADLELSGAVPGASTLQLTNVGTATANVSVKLGDSAEDVVVEAGTTASVVVPEAELVKVQVTSDEPLVGAAVRGEAVAVLSPGSLVEPEPMNAELVPTLR